MTEVRVPTLGESVTEATIATWFKKIGDSVAVDEMICELETDKVTVEVPSHVAGTLTKIIAAEAQVARVALRKEFGIDSFAAFRALPSDKKAAYMARNAKHGSTVSDFVDHIDYVKNLVGIDYVALGSDFDGFIPLPREMRDVTDLPVITQCMLNRGYSENEVD